MSEENLPEVKKDKLPAQDQGEYAMLFDTARFEQAYRVAKLFSESKLVPAHFQGNPAGVFVVLHMATRMNLDPFMVLQKTYMVHGRPGMEAQLVIALVNARGPFTGPIQWRFEGEGKDRKCTAFATHKVTGELCEMPVTWAMVEAEGWNRDKELRAGGGVQKSKWNTLTDMMFRYRSATYLARAYCPEVTMGISTVDELEDMGVIDLDVDIPKVIISKSEPTQTEKVKRRLRKPKESLEPPAKTTEVSTPANEHGNGESPVRGITDEQRTYLLAVPEDILGKAYRELDTNVPITELDFHTADKLITHLRQI